jgi:cyclopropane-fatty-acyl-phospholipid synthase
MTEAAEHIIALAEFAAGEPLPVRVRAWDGSVAGADDGPALVIGRRALRRALWKPGELGVARAWVAGDLDVQGDLYEALERVEPLGGGERPSPRAVLAALRDPRVRGPVRALLRLTGFGPPPAVPAEEIRRRHGGRHSLRRDRAAIAHHYDVGNEFYELVLGESMVYSCGYWDEQALTLGDAQRAKLDLVCRKLGLRPGLRLLDVGCGWGSMVLHAAARYGVRATGVTLSAEQAGYARARVAEAGLDDLVDIRVQDYREIIDGPYDAISSIGMAEHVGRTQYSVYADSLFHLLRPGGRLLNHQIAHRPRRHQQHYRVDRFIDRYVFPDGELLSLGDTVAVLEQAGLEVRDVEGLREHYARTLRCWVANLERNWDRAVRLTSPGRARVWRLYMAASALSFEHDRISVNQVLAVRPTDEGASGMPSTRRGLTAGTPGGPTRDAQ